MDKNENFIEVRFSYKDKDNISIKFNKSVPYNYLDYDELELLLVLFKEFLGSCGFNIGINDELVVRYFKPKQKERDCSNCSWLMM